VSHLTRSTLLALALLGAAPRPAAAQVSLTLDEALAQAARQSHDLAVARADAGLADADASTAFAGLLPRLDLTSSGGRQYVASSVFQVAPGVFQAVPSTSTETYALGLKLQQPLVSLGSWRQLWQARATSRAASRGYDESRLAVAFDVTRLFYELVKAVRSLAVLEKAAARSEELVTRSDALYAAGRAQKADTFAARVNLGNDRIAVEQARTRVVQVRTDLAVALGLPGDQLVEPVAPATLEASVLPAGEPPPLAALLEMARARRPTLAAATAQIEAADEAVGVASAGWAPTLAAQLTYDRSGTEAGGRSGVFDDPRRQYAATAQLVLSWNLYAGGSTEAGRQRARIAAERTRATAAKTADGVAREVASARQAVVALVRQVALSADNLGAADQGLALARQRLEAGLASQLEVRDATLKLTQAELTLVQARIDHAVAVADLNRAVGGAL
jgi:outer membrane protein TolC